MEPPETGGPLPTGTPVVVLSGVRWDFLWQRHQEIPSRLARRGHPMVFVETTGLSNPRPEPETFRKVLNRISRPGGQRSGTGPGVESLVVYSPVVAPPTVEAFRSLNRRVLLPKVARDLRDLAGGRPAVIAYPPTRTTLDLVQEISPVRLLYDCSDDYESFPGVPRDIARTERELLRRADAVSCTSEFLLEKARRVRPDAYLAGPGVDFEAFNVLSAKGSIREVETVCFFGHVGHRLDLRVLQEISRSGFTVRLVGEVERSARWLLDEPGVDYRGTVPHRDLPQALSGVDAFVLPYRLSGEGPGISPAKTFECLATGLPVVASPLPALKALEGHVYLADGPSEFVRCLRELPAAETPERAAARVGLARRNDWGRQVDAIERDLCLVG